jgi:hypothetical protein
VVCIDAAPAEELRRLRREITAWRGRVTLEIGTHEQRDPMAQLRARARLS